MRSVGVDGCRSGWLAVTRSRTGLDCRIFPDIAAIVEEYGPAARIFIDVPIGLPSAGCPVRPCDTHARRLLGIRRSSVFPVPCRQALAAATLERARRINTRQLGRSIGAQTWNISGKIAEVDLFLRANRRWSTQVREIHPELCFWALAGRHAMTHGKKSAAGQAERVAVLERYEPSTGIFLADALSRTKRRDVQADDVLDALAALLTAEARAGELVSVCEDVIHDDEGLPMDMLYRDALSTAGRPGT